MTTPDPKATLPSGKIIIEEAPFDGAHHGRVDGDWRPVAEEAPADNKQYARQNGGWSEVTGGTPTDYGIGLDYDETATPPIVNLQPPNLMTWQDPTPRIGGINVPPRSSTQGLAIEGNGLTQAPLATPDLAGSIVEPPADARGYVRTTQLDGTSQWVPPALTPTEYGTGLTYDETATPPIVHLQPATDFSIGGLMEPAQDGIAHSRQFDTINQVWVWTPALTAGLQITSIIPDKTIYGPGEPLLTVHAYGSEFTDTCVIRVDGNDATTGYVSETELTFVLNPAVPISDQFHIITVHETAPAPVDGLGAEQFDFIKASTEVDYGTGLSLDTTPDPPIVHLQPAGPTDKLLGGVWVPPRDATQGLAIDMGDETLGDPATGELRAPLATPELAGSIVEPPADAKGYVRTTQLDGISQWVPPALTPTEYGVGLTYDETADPPIVHLQPAGFQQKFLGGIWAPARSLTQALDLNPATGLLQAPQATHEHLGAILEPRETGKTFGRQRDPTTGIADWVEVAGGGGIGDVPLDPVQPWSRTPGRWVAAIPEVPPDDVLHARRGGDPATWEPFLPFEDVPVDPTGQQYSRQHGNWHPIPPPHIENPAGKTEPEIGVVFVPDRSGLSVGPDGALWLEPATADEIGGLREVPGDGEWVRKRGAWEPLPPGSTVEAGIGLEKTGDVIDLQPPVASDPTNNIAPEIGGVYGTPRSERNGIEIDGYGHISAPLATPELAGTIIEPVADAKGYVRTTQLDGTSQWVPPASTDMATHTELGTVRVPARNDHNQGLNLDDNGFLFAPPATPDHLGTILEPRDPRALHARVRDGTTGNAEWEMFEPGIGDVSDTVNVYGRTNSRWIQLQPGGTFPPASMLYVQINGDTMQGPLYLHAEGVLAMEAVTVSQLERMQVQAGIGLTQIGQRIYLKPATNIQIGGLLDAPDDGQQYARKFREWERVAPSATPVTYGIGIDETAGVVNLKQANFNGEIGGVMVVGRGPTQGLEYDAATGTLWAPLATDIAAGAIVEPPPDGSQYCRTRDMGGLSTWVRSAAGGVIVADDPPDEAMTPAGTLWWESDTGELYILYDDGTSKQWVEAVATPNAGVQTHIGDLPPAIANVGDLWWDSDAGTLAIYYQDVDSTQWVQIAGPMPPPAAGGIAEAPIDGTPYNRQDAAWVAAAAAAGGLPDAPNDGVQYTRGAPAAGGVNAWTPSTAATGAFLPLTGGTLTGNMFIDAVNPTIFLDKSGATGGFAEIAGLRGGLRRFGVELASDTADHFNVRRYNDAGAPVDVPLSIARDTGITNFTATPTVNGVPIGGGAAIDAYTKVESDAKYFPFAGGTITGNVTVNGVATFANHVNIGTAAALRNLSLHGYLLVTDDQQVYFDGAGPVNTSSKGILFRKSATESAILHGRICSRSDDYSQGIIEFQLNNEANGVVGSVFFNGGLAQERWANFSAMSVQCNDVFETSMAADKTDIRDVQKAEVDTAWKTLKPKKFRRKYAEDSTTGPLRYGFVMEDMADELTKKRPPSTQGNTSGYSIGQVLALTVAKLKEVEAELAALRAKVK